MPVDDVAVIGVGPYGLAAAARLRRAGLAVGIFGRRTMSFWEEHMPRCMLLRSAREASYIGYPSGGLTLESYQSETGSSVPDPIPVEQFVDYGRWFEQKAVGAVDRREVVGVELGRDGFRLRLDDGDGAAVRRVVVATGIARFAWIPPELAGLPPERLSHSVDHADLGRFAGDDVLVVGGGQSALESAALLQEAGAASVEVVVRRPEVRWLRGRAAMSSKLGPLKPLVYPQTDVGPPGLNLVVAVPETLRLFPRRARDAMAQRAIRPAGAAWLQPRLSSVPIRTGRTVTSARVAGGRLEVVLNDGTSRTVDHLLLATGYKIDVARHDFLSDRLLAALRRVNGYPVLGNGFESSVPGLHFLGAPAAWSFGPLMRFVSGTWYSAEGLVHAIATAPAPARG
jgi:cation diffusion facilitator CzcD-associated flavoprotein CzcO